MWILRLAFLGLLYLFLAVLTRGLLRDLRGATARTTRAAGVLVVMAAPAGAPPRRGDDGAGDDHHHRA